MGKFNKLMGSIGDTMNRIEKIKSETDPAGASERKEQLDYQFARLKALQAEFTNLGVTNRIFRVRVLKGYLYLSGLEEQDVRDLVKYRYQTDILAMTEIVPGVISNFKS